ncbi:hypothetical protein [Bosea sp. LC85]|uniref:hypothetical protein n=1 Tax=Bosea sp. LC85 TaxID=1502851 RepID=UPI000698F725|nr:hypothetical protein [Bosea sp. LC85]
MPDQREAACSLAHGSVSETTVPVIHSAATPDMTRRVIHAACATHVADRIIRPAPTPSLIDCIVWLASLRTRLVACSVGLRAGLVTNCIS